MEHMHKVNRLAFAVVLGIFLWDPSAAFACVTKSGKDCSATASKKVIYSKKAFVVAPAGDVGATTTATGFDPLGLPTADLAAPSPDAQSPDYGSNPDGWFYLIPSGKAASHLAPKPMPYSVAKRLSDIQARRGAPTILNPDGSLSAHALGEGWVRVLAPAPNQVPKQTVQAPAPIQQTQPGLQPQIVKAPNQVPQQTVQAPAPIQQAQPGLQPPSQAPDYGSNPDGWFYLIPSGKAASGLGSKPVPYSVARRLSDNQARRGAPTILNPDGSLSAHALGEGWVRVLAPAPNQVPQQTVRTPAPIQQTQPGLQPQVVTAPNQVPQQTLQTPAPIQQAQPGLQPQVVTAPNQVPQQTLQAPAPNQQAQPGLQPQVVTAPNQVPQQTVQAPVPNQQAQPGLQPQIVTAPNQVPQQTLQAPAPNQQAQPGLQPQVVTGPNQAPQRPSLVRAPNLLPGHAAAGPDRAHPDRRVEVYHPERAGVYRYEDATQIGDPAFHLVVIGFREPE